MSMTYTNQQGFFGSSKDNSSLFYQKWLPDNRNQDRHVVFIHGGLEHSGRYQHLIDYFVEDGVSFYALDLRGHGKSREKTKDFGTIDLMTEDVKNFLEYLRTKHWVEKPIIIGHSLGGLITLNFSLNPDNQNKIAGLYVSAASLTLKYHPVLWLKKILAKNILNYLCPHLKIAVGLNLKYLSHDKNVIKKYKKDPLVFHSLPVRFAVDVMDKGEEVVRQAQSIEQLPIFLAHGEADGIAYAQGSVDMFHGIKSDRKKIKIYPDCYHELFNEVKPKREEVLKDLREWAVALWEENKNKSM